MIATSEEHGTSRPNDVVVSIRFPTGSSKPYTYFVESRFNVKIGDTVVVNTSRTPEAALQYVEVIDVIDDIFSVEGIHKRIVRVHTRSAERKTFDVGAAFSENFKFIASRTVIVHALSKQGQAFRLLAPTSWSLETGDTVNDGTDWFNVLKITENDRVFRAIKPAKFFQKARRTRMPPELGMGYALDKEPHRQTLTLSDEISKIFGEADKQVPTDALLISRSYDAALSELWKRANEQYDKTHTHTLSGTAAQPQNLPKETTMLKIEKRTYINSVDAATLTDDTLFELVISTEADIKHLDNIQLKSEKVQLKIEQLRKSIKELNTYIDSRPGSF